MIEITPTVASHFVTCNPLLDIYHVGNLEANQTIWSGQPIIIYDIDQTTDLDLVFSSYTISEEQLSSYTPYEATFSIYTTEAEAQEVADKVNEHDFIYINLIKHPVNNEWAIAYTNTVFNHIPEGATKTWLYDKHQESISLNRSHDKQYLIDNGW